MRGGGRDKGYVELTDQQIQPISKLWVRRETLSQNIKWLLMEEDAQHCPVASTCSHAGSHAHTDVHRCVTHVSGPAGVEAGA